jgi:phosphoribosylformylglycinamidine (FGAM) synthase-like enzyme
VVAAARAFGLDPADSAAVFEDPETAVRFAGEVIGAVRARNTPWFQKQFIGKPHSRLMVVGEETDQYIQGITGATISSVALTSSVKKAIQELEKAGGGFEEVPDE